MRLVYGESPLWRKLLPRLVTKPFCPGEEYFGNMFGIATLESFRQSNDYHLERPSAQNELLMAYLAFEAAIEALFNTQDPFEISQKQMNDYKKLIKSMYLYYFALLSTGE